MAGCSVMAEKQLQTHRDAVHQDSLSIQIGLKNFASLHSWFRKFTLASDQYIVSADTQQPGIRIGIWKEKMVSEHL